MIITALSIAALVPATYLFMQQPAFGQTPAGSRMERIKRSPNFRDGAFQNEHETPVKPDSVSYASIMWEFFFRKDKLNKPPRPIPTVKTDLKSLPDSTPSLVWFGHSSYLIKTKGTHILVDPVLSGYASPVSFAGKSFPGSDAYTVEDLPAIDGCIITHDHFDHLDHETVTKLKDRVKMFYTGLGVGAHLEKWGVDPAKIVELDWWEGHAADSTLRITATPARHFSGRGFSRNGTLWASFVIEVHGFRIYAGGDSGYDTHFERIGQQFGPFDLVMLECGQYGKDWPLIHMTPEETAKAASDLKARALLPVHWAKFSLALHAWNEPIRRLLEANEGSGIRVTTPVIGEPVIVNSVYPNSKWWNF